MKFRCPTCGSFKQGQKRHSRTRNAEDINRNRNIYRIVPWRDTPDWRERWRAQFGVTPPKDAC